MSRRRGRVTPYRTKQGERWAARVTLPPHPETGQRRTRSQSGFLLKKDAEKALTRMLAEADAGAIVDPSRLTVGELAERWLADEAAHTVRPSTLTGYSQTVATHISGRAIGRKRAQTLTVADVAAYRGELAREAGGRAGQLALLRLKQILGWAHRLELLARNVAEGVAPIAHHTEERRALTHAEARTLLALARDDYYHPLWHLYLATGLRRGEGLGLRWGDLDLHRGLLTVRQQVIKSGKPSRPLIVELKTRNARRTIEIDDELILALETHRHERSKATPWFEHDLVFHTRNGLPHDPVNVLSAFHALREASHLGRDITIHSLRHTHATHLILAGVPIVEVSRRLGHSKVSVTTDTYSHLLSDYQGSSVEAVRAALYGSELPALS